MKQWFILITKLILFGIITSLFLRSCSNRKSEPGFKLTLYDTISFKLDENNDTKTKAIFYHEENGKRYFAYDDEAWNFIRVYDIDSREKIHDIPLPLFNEGLPLFRCGFVIKNFDSIFIPADGYKILLLNKNGDIVKKINFLELKNKYADLNNILSFSRFSKGAIIVGNSIHFLQYDSPIYSKKNLRPSDFKFSFRYDMRNDAVTLMDIALPDSFWKGGIKQMSLSMAFDGERFVYAPQYSHNIYISNNNTRIKKHFIAKSKYVTSLNSYYPSGIIPTYEEFSNIYCTSHFYIGLLWDKYRQVYYRFYWPGIGDTEAKDKHTISEIFHNNPNYGIIVLDKDFKVIDELILPEYVYSWDKYFVAKEGLFLSADNAEYPYIKKDTWTFHIYKLDSIPQEKRKYPASSVL